MSSSIDVLPSLALDGISTLATRTNPRLALFGRRHGIEEEFFAVGEADYNRQTLQYWKPYNFPNAVEIHPDPSRVQEEGGFHGNHTYALDRIETWQYLNEELNDLHAAAGLATGSDTHFSTWTYSTAGHKEPGRHRLEDLHRKIKEHRLGLMVLPHETYIRDRLIEDYEIALEFAAHGLLISTLVSDNLSPLAQLWGRDFADDLKCFGVSQMLAAHAHSTGQKSPTDYLYALNSPICTTGFGTRRLLAGKESVLYGGLRRTFHWEARGEGVPQDIIDRGREAAFQALEDPEWRAMDIAYDPYTQGFCFVSHPDIHDPTPDQRILRHIHTEIERDVVAKYPHVLVVFLIANGLPTPKQAHLPLWITATALWGVESSAPLGLVKRPRPTLLPDRTSQVAETDPPQLPTPPVTITEIATPSTPERKKTHAGKTADGTPAHPGNAHPRVRRLPPPGDAESA